MTSMTADESDLLTQREADLAAVERARLAGFRGPTFEGLIAGLYRYAGPVMLDAIGNGDIVNIRTSLPKRAIASDKRQLLHGSSDEKEDLALAWPGGAYNGSWPGASSAARARSARASSSRPSAW